MQKGYLLILILFPCLVITAQEKPILRGHIVASHTGQPVKGANIIVFQSTDGVTFKPFGFTSSRDNGDYELAAKTGSLLFRLVFTHAGFKSDTLQMGMDQVTGGYEPTISLEPASQLLKEVKVKNEGVKISGDTIEYNASDHRGLDTRKVEDLLRNIDGFSVSPNGRLAYRGKEIKVVMINGENIAGDQYEVLTKNLNAGFVDKVQVIDNFHKNRIIGSIVKSGEAAVNLELNGDLEGKVSGSLAAASSLTGRQEADANLLWLKKKFKVIALGNYNTISKPGYREMVAGMMELQPGTETNFPDRLYAGSAVVQAPSISLPSVKPSYFNRNEDITLSPMFHFRFSRSVSLALKFTSAYDTKRYSSRSLNEILVSPVINWATFNTRSLSLLGNMNQLSAVLTHDNKKKFAGELTVQAGVMLSRNRLDDYSSGALVDTLQEQFRIRNKGLALGYSGAVKLSDYTVITISSETTRLIEDLDLTAATLRYNRLWQTGPGQNLINQQTGFRNIETKNSISGIYRRGQHTARVSAISLFQSIGLPSSVITATPAGHAAGSTTVYARPAVSAMNRWDHYLQTSISRDLKKQFTAELTGKLGLQGIRTTTVKNRNELGWDFSAIIRKRIRTFSGISLAFQNMQTLPSLSWFVPGSYLQSDGGWFSGATVLRPIRSNRISLSVSNSKIINARSISFNTWIKHSATDYVFASFIDTAIVRTYPIPVSGNKEYGATGSARKYFFALKSTFGVNAAVRTNKGTTVVNDLYRDYRQTNGTAGLNWISKFNFPVNLDLSFTKSFMKNSQEGVRTSSDWISLLAKTRLQFNEFYYFGAEYNLLKYRDQRAFNVMDFSGTYVFNKRLSADARLHNVFNIRRSGQLVAGANFRSEQAVHTIGRYLLLRLNWSF